jgi:Glycoside hydrolase family 44/Bacterial Ig-like domain (group 3)
MQILCRRAPALLLIMLIVCGVQSLPAQTGGAPTLGVDASASVHPISPQIYGIDNFVLDATFAKEIQVPNVRWGGDDTTRYNWEVDSSNQGFTFYFLGGTGQATPVPGATVDNMVNTYKPAESLVTIPIIPYVNKSAAYTCSFPVSVYGAQQATDPYPLANGEVCGNSLTPSGTQLTDNNIYANHIDNSTTLQQQWMQHLVGTFGTAANGGVKFYQLDNEPYAWSNIHRDVMPVQATYPTITQLGQQYAAVVKQVDSTALILGPSDWSGGWIGDSTTQNGLFAGQYYLQQMAAYEQANGQRILDYFDEHYYPDVSTPAIQLASTRTLWDPTYNGGTTVEQYDFMGPMMLIPRLRSWISQYYPGTLLAISEYSIDSGQKSIVDAIAEMDVLGIFGQQPLDFANMWNPPGPQDPIAFAFRMFRNYDGNGSQFGDTSFSATSSDPGSLSIYAAQRSSDNAVTIMVINKTTSAVTSAISLANLNLPASAQVYTYSQASLTAIAHPSDAAITYGSLNYTYPAYSAVLFVLQPNTTSSAPTTTTLSASAAQINAGQTVTFSVAITAASGSTPTGNITLLDGANSLGTAALSNGAAGFTVPSLAAGTHTITASYAGDAADGASTSNAVSIQVNALASSVTLAATPATALTGQAISLTAAVTPAAATGKITFMDGSNAIGSATLASGSGALAVSTLSAGSHTLTAVYGGSAVYAPSTSSPVTVTLSAPIPPDYSLTLSSGTLSIAQSTPGTLTLSVTPENGFDASLSFACTGLPSGLGCSFAPSTLSGTKPETTTMTVSANTSSLMQAPSGLFLALVAPLPLFLLGLSGKSRAGRSILLVALAVLLTGCGGSSGTTTPPQSTTATNPQSATYNVTVTASGPSAPTHTQTFVLTVTQ